MMTKEDKDILAQQESDNDSGDDTPRKRNSGRRKIKIEYIEDKNRRHITFSKRKAGIMKKAYELSTLTGTQVLLLVVSETGLVYTFTTVKLQPIVTKPEGKSLIQACLNAPDPGMEGSGGAMDENDAGSVGSQKAVDQQQQQQQQQQQAPPASPKQEAVSPSMMRQAMPNAYPQTAYSQQMPPLPPQSHYQQGYPYGVPHAQQQQPNQQQYPPYNQMPYYSSQPRKN